MKEGAVIIEVRGVRYQVSDWYPHLHMELYDCWSRPYWSADIPEDEKDALWSEIVRRLNKEEEQ